MEEILQLFGAIFVHVGLARDAVGDAALVDCASFRFGECLFFDKFTSNFDFYAKS